MLMLLLTSVIIIIITHQIVIILFLSLKRKAGRFPFFPGQEPTLPGNADFLLQV